MRQMIGYVTIGTNDFERAAKFYDALFAVVGIERLWSHDTTAAYARSRDDTALCITVPHDGKPATVGNGVMAAIRVRSPAEVDAMHAKALELGGSDEGAPGSRGSSGFYGGYFRDLEGNKLNAYVAG